MIGCVAYFLVTFTEMVDNQTNKYSLGWTQVIIFCVTFFFNIILIFYVTFNQIRLLYMKYSYKLDRCKYALSNKMGDCLESIKDKVGIRSSIKMAPEERIKQDIKDFTEMQKQEKAMRYYKNIDKLTEKKKK